MGLSCHNNLNGTFGMGQQFNEPLLVLKDKGCALVSGKATAKSNGEDFRIEHLGGNLNLSK